MQPCYEHKANHVGEPTDWTIALVICIWRPPNEQKSDNSMQDISANRQSELQNSEGPNSFQQLWLWIHAQLSEKDVI